MRKNYFGFAPIMIIIILAILGIGYFAYQNFQLKKELGEKESFQTPTPEAQSAGGPTSTPSVSNGYTPGKEWKTINHPGLGIALCLPPKWDFSKNGDGSLSSNLVYYRDAQYAPNFAYFQSIPYSEGSKREAYFEYWEKEYPNIRDLASISDIDVNGNSVLVITQSEGAGTNFPPDGNLAAVWYAGGKLWKTSLSSWQQVNPSQSAFLNDFYTAISCSF